MLVISKISQLLSFREKAVLFPVLALRYVLSVLLGLINRRSISRLGAYDNLKRLISAGAVIKRCPSSEDELLVFLGSGALKDTIIKVRKGSTDIDVLVQVLIDEEYKALVEIVKQRLCDQSAVNIVDAGANIGCTSVYLKRHFPNAQIIAIEPNLDNCRVLEENMKLNNLEGVKLLRAGLWNDEVDLTIDTSFRDGKEWSLALRESEGSSDNNPVKGVTLETVKGLFRNQMIDLLKVDIEGGERFIFCDSQYADEFLTDVKCMAIEVHDEFNIRRPIIESLRRNQFVHFEQSQTLFAFRKEGDIGAKIRS